MTSFSNDNDRHLTSEARGMFLGVMISLGLWGAFLFAIIMAVTMGSRTVHDAQIASARAPQPATIEAQP